MRWNVPAPGLKTKLTLVVLLLSLGSIWLLTYLITARLQDDYAKVLSRQQFSSVNYAVAEIEQRTRHRFDELQGSARKIAPPLLADPARLRALLEGSAELNRLFGNGILVVSPTGKLIARYPENPLQSNALPEDIEYLRDVIASGQPAIGKPRIGRVTGKPGVAFAVPIHDDAGRIDGVLIGFSSLSDPTLFGQIERANIGQSGWTAVSDARFRLIAAISDPKRTPLQPFPPRGVNRLLDSFADGYSGSGVTTNSQGREVLASGQQIPGTPWFVQAVLPTDEAFAPSRAMAERAYAFAVGASLLISLGVWLFVRRLFQPLTTTTTLIRAMAEGREPVQGLPVPRRDEVGELLMAFNLLFQQRLQAEAEQGRLNRALRLLSDCNTVVVRASDEGELLNAVCRLVVESGGYLMAWVGAAEQDAAKSVRPVARSGYEDGYLENLQVSWDGEREAGRGPTGTAIRSASTQVNQDSLHSPQMAPWREAILKRGYRSSVALPLKTPTRMLGVLTLYSAQPQAFTDSEVMLLEELASNVAFGLQSLRARNELDRHQQHLETLVAQRTAETVALNAALEARARDAEAATLAKSAFLATLSHEIRTPLNAVVGLSGLLADAGLNRHQRDCADKIQLSAQALRALIDDILDFSKIEAGSLQLEKVPFSLNTILRTTAAVLAQHKQGKPIEALFDIAPDVPAILIGDGLRLQQILLNLTSNAVKFTHAGSIVIALRCLRREAGKVSLQVTVRDTGIGISPEQLTHIFEPFAQADSSTSRKYGGSGLGLAICTRLIGLMGGRLTASSQPGQGSEFRFAVNFDFADDPPPAPSGALAGLNILIVDDHPLARDILQQICAQFGWQSTAVASAAKGLEELHRSVAEARDYDLLLLDWRMPGMDGLEMLRQAWNTPGIALPLVVLMASTFELEQAVTASADVHLDAMVAKPITPASLFEAIERAYCGESPDPSPLSAEPDRRLGGLHLLVAEDNELNRQVVEQILIGAGATVVTTDNGCAAIEVLRQPGARFDAVLMDIQMPIMDGYATTRVIREEMGLVDLPIIALTAHAQAADYQKSRAAGMAGHVTKPIDVDDLLDILAGGSRPAPHPAAAAGEPARDPASALPVLDLASGLAMFGQDKAAYGSLLREFAGAHRDDLEQVRRRLAADDTPGAVELIHALCGVASFLRASALAALAASAERALLGGNAAREADLFDQLQAAMSALLEAIERFDAPPLAARQDALAPVT